ncbi:MAG: DUF2236 domain-containing protein [Solirubrobacteraceae bacterium]|nr:DUF2236 domain-containing protein [Solirubrobacteraceae bacterium]
MSAQPAITPDFKPSRLGDVEAAKRHHDPALVDRIIAATYASDDPADALVARFSQLPGGAGWRMLDTALSHGIDAVDDAPAELAPVLAGAVTTPDWVDLDLVDKGTVAWWRVGGPLQLLALTSGSLAYGYSTSFARPLLMTGRLKQMAPRRLGETANWVVTATRPGGLRPGAKGLHDTVRIRLVHALVRKHLLSTGEWDVPNWGVPMSIADTMATGTIGFFLYPVRGLQDFGVRFSNDELEAITHLWMYINFLMGVPREELPTSFAEAEAWGDAASELEDVDIEDAHLLVDSLLFDGLAYDRVLPKPIAQAARVSVGHGMAAVARHWMGDPLADDLRIPNTQMRRIIPVLRALISFRERMRAAGLAPSDERVVAFEMWAGDRVMKLAGTKPAINPTDAAKKPALA